MTRLPIVLTVLATIALLAGCGHKNLDKYDWDKLSASPEYVVGPEDVLYVEFWQRDDMTKEVTVRPDGFLDLPLIGEVDAQGKTPEELKQLITRKMTAFEKAPVVTVTVRKVMSYRIYVLGKVQKPGLYNPTQKVTVLQALALAGGPTTFADEDKAVIIRRDGTTERRIPFVYSKVVGGSYPQMNIILSTGDTIVIP